MSDTEIEAMAVAAGLLAPDAACSRGPMLAFAELVRAAALELAAKSCDERSRLRAQNGFPREASAARADAAAIRALK